ncbi:hypothetical protein [Rufibacter quisquiliarum]|uniref:Lipoprotein n=1 Tax=Rufibacter quisquiliarum TaxID=1549639 RepID=A0A839GUF4_9BACT|nr:hypothetical protein [Rufibacter quisquiliarum]MBA9077411.1 hypothetical protein [Rufibacter quisquiliarum]
MRRILIVLALVAGFFSSCSDEEVVLDPVKQGYDYYPLEVGSYRIYHVTETRYRDNVGQTTEYERRELIDAITKDQTGKEWYRVEVSRREPGASSWSVKGVKLLSASPTSLQVQENNRSTVLMVFPVVSGKTWVHDAFSKISTTDTIYAYENAGEAFEMNSRKYDKTVKILKNYYKDLLVLDDRYEVLAFQVGPVYRHSKVYQYCNDGSGNACERGVDYIQEGNDVIEELVETGKI